MEESTTWSEVCLRWARGVNIVPCIPSLGALTDGKFFSEFMVQFLQKSTVQETTSQTFTELSNLLKEEFPNQCIVQVNEAAEGAEDEILKLMTLLMYLGSVEWRHPVLSSLVLDNTVFSREIQLRLKCIFKAMSEQRSLLDSATLTTMIMSRVSETTGLLADPAPRARIPSSNLYRAKKASPGSPVIFQYTPGSGSPGKQPMDSPVSSQVHRLLEERTQQLRQLRTDLEAERSEKQYSAQELETIKIEKTRLEHEIQRLKQEKREQAAKEDFNLSVNMESEVKEKFHKLLEDKKKGQNT
jgi:hypothetical protein